MWNESIPDLVDDLFESNGPHGDPNETALIQHLAPELVREDELDAAAEGGLWTFSDDDARQRGARTFYDAIDNTDNGVIGDQRDSTAEKGAQLYETATEQLVALLGWLDDRRSRI